MLSANTRVCLFVLLVLSLASASATAYGGGPSNTITSATLADDSPRLVAGETQNTAAVHVTANNSSSTEHEHPDQVAGEGDEAVVTQWFERQLSDRLEESAAKLDQGEYEQAQSVLGDEYDDLYDRYVDIEGNTDVEGSTGGTGETTTEDTETATAAEQFKDARERQQEYVATLEAYQETRRQYDQAKQTGNETRARQLARDLDRLADQLNRSRTNITDTYGALSNTTTTNMTATQREINQTTANISTQQTAIRTQTFTPTTLSLQSPASTVSFREPLQVTGQLTAENGTTLTNRTILVTLGSQTVQTRTTANGTFMAIVRPTTVARGTQSVDVAYQPRDTAVYLGTNETVTVNVTQVTPTVTLSDVSQSVRFNETVTVDGTVSVNNVSAAGVPVRILVGSTVLTTTRTTANGTFMTETPLPAGVPSGTSTLRATLPLTDRALANATTTETLTVGERSTQLTAERARQAESVVDVTGTLTTAIGDPLANQTLSIRVNGTTIETVPTNESGHYAVSLNTSMLAQMDSDTATVAVMYPETGNLAGTQTTVTVNLGEQDSAWLPVSPQLIFLIGLLGLGAVGGLVIRRFDIFTGSGTADAAVMDDDQTTPSDEPPDTPASTPDTTMLLDQAATLCDDGTTDTAVLLAYEAARYHLTEQLALASTQVASQTHWEFYSTCRRAGVLDNDQHDALEQLTEAYEHARFTAETTAMETATAALNGATRVVETGDTNE